MAPNSLLFCNPCRSLFAVQRLPPPPTQRPPTQRPPTQRPLLRAAAAVRQTRRLVTIDFRISLTLATAAVHKAAAFEAVHTTRSDQSIPSELSLYASNLIIIWAVGTRPSASLFRSILVLSRCVRRGDHPSDRAPILHPPPTWRAVGFRCSERAPESNSVRSGARLLKFGLSNPLHWPPLHEGPGSPDLT